MAPKVRPSREEPAVPPTGAASVIDFSESGEFDCAQLTATLFVFFAALALILDVCLGHQHQLIAGTAAMSMILGAALLNAFRQICLEGNKKKMACNALVDNVILLINLICLDTFLYEEETYNYWGHSDNQLKSERTMGAFLEIFIAIIATWTIYRMYRKRTDAYIKKQESFKKKKPTGMV